MQPFTLRFLIPFTLVVLLLAACGESNDDAARVSFGSSILNGC